MQDGIVGSSSASSSSVQSLQRLTEMNEFINFMKHSGEQCILIVWNSVTFSCVLTSIIDLCSPMFFFVR